MKVVKAAAVQISPVLYSREATVEKVVQKIQELGRKGVQSALYTPSTPSQTTNNILTIFSLRLPNYTGLTA